MNEEQIKFEKHIEQAKTEILEDIESKLVPKNINCFEDLHLYVDANYYGGLCDENYVISEDFVFENKLQGAIDKWLKGGRNE